ncbi:MAB_1171c family putative transporter [Pseudonocardia sp. ICBG601]|uniref:MAB_1171c family putative transporter n=1 Tax=Pseudonocardia sp. ICBG601 TaxID=2846759 RepID=UPI0027E2A70E|nr:MAB_1171c family putative transporter [Pseudonocardia sp. ICBG601]
MLHDAIQFMLVGLIIGAAIAKLFQLRFPGAETNRPAAIAMCAAIIFMGIATFQEGMVVTDFLERSLDINIAYAQRHAPAIISFACVRIAFVCWTWPSSLRRRRRVTMHLVVLAVILATRWAIAAVSSPHDAAAGLAGDWAAAPWTTMAALLYIVYVGSTFVSVAVMASGWAREETVAHRWTATGLKLIAASAFGFCMYVGHKMLFLLAAHTVGRPGYDPLAAERPILVVSVFLLVVGLAVPLVATGVPAAVLLARQRAVYREIGSMWLSLVSIRPDVVLMTWAPTWLPDRWIGLWEAVDVREMAFRLFRRVIECWDIVRRLRPHLDASLRAWALTRARAELDEATAESVGDAVMLRVALARARSGAAVLDEAQRALTPASLRELGQNATWWQRVARAWDHPLTLRLTDEATAHSPVSM